MDLFESDKNFVAKTDIIYCSIMEPSKIISLEILDIIIDTN